MAGVFISDITLPFTLTSFGCRDLQYDKIVLCNTPRQLKVNEMTSFTYEIPSRHS